MEAAPNKNLSYAEFRAANWKPKKDEMGGTIGPRSFDEWKATKNVVAPGHDVTISMAPRGVESAVEDGRIKNVYELPKEASGYRGTRSETYMKNRTATEKAVLGVPDRAGAARRPVYGHVRETGDPNAEGNQYGRVHLDLWPGKNHITTTDTDSLDTLVENHGRAPKVSRAEAWAETGFDDLSEEHKPNESGWDYREAQIHGGVPMSGTHIKRATVMEGSGNDHFLTQGLRAKGIPTTVSRTWEQPSLYTDEHITHQLPTGQKFLDYKDKPMTRGQQFHAGIPKEWENNRAPQWVRNA